MVFDATPFINKIQKTIDETGFTVLTVEYDNNHKMITRTYPVDEIIYKQSSCMFLYKKEKMFFWNEQENYRIYEGTVVGLDFVVERLQTSMSKEDLRKVVDKCYEEYGWSYNYFGTINDVNRFADEYYLTDESRWLLQLVVVEKKQEDYVKKYGVENPRFNQLIREYGG